MNNSCIFKKVVMMFLLLVGTLNVYSQHVVTGKVIDEQGPLIGASVKVKDAAVPTGTVTDAEGKYSIKVPNSKTILVYSYIGYVDKAEAVGKRTVVNVTLEEDSKMLDDVVVIGYGTQAKSHLTGSISKLEGEKLINAPVSDVTTALQGAMTGLTVSNETSEVGVTPSIRVRGTGSISADSEPLVIIDGFPVSGGLSSINAADVKSIEILKDAASAAIYGSRAANGVIMVTTKSGTPDKPKYSFKFYQGFKYAYQLHDMMTSSEWLGLLEEEAALGGPKVPSAARGAAYLESQMGTTDWQKEGLRDMAGIDVYAQSTVTPARKDTTIIQREAPKARARRHRDPIIQDSVKKDSIQIIPSKELPAIDSLSAAKIQIADSLDAANKKELKKIEQPASIVVKTDTVPPPAQDINKKIFIPNPTKATWLAVVFPGGGQIYNRKYWKLPIIYGGFAGCAYALSWNGKMYKDYSQAYLDIMDSNPNTKSYEDLLPPNSTYNEEQLKNTLKRRKDMFRRYRDLSIFAFIGVYLISIIDAYVDAELSNFDITPDLSMKVEPAVIDNNNQFRSNSFKNKSVGLQCVLRF